VGTVNMVGGAVLEWHGLINCTALLMMTGRVHSQKKWSMSC
jgi:hypothetical protein